MRYKISTGFLTKFPYATLKQDGGLSWSHKDYTLFTKEQAEIAIANTIKQHPHMRRGDFNLEEEEGESA